MARTSSLLRRASRRRARWASATCREAAPPLGPSTCAQAPGHLHGEGAGPARGVPRAQQPPDGPRQGAPIHAHVVVEAPVFDGHDGLSGEDRDVGGGQACRGRRGAVRAAAVRPPPSRGRSSPAPPRPRLLEAATRARASPPAARFRCRGARASATADAPAPLPGESAGGALETDASAQMEATGARRSQRPAARRARRRFHSIPSMNRWLR